MTKPMHRIFFVAFAVASACASQKDKLKWEDVEPPMSSRPPPVFDGKEFAMNAAGYKPPQCEQAAREFFRGKAEDAWSALKICAKNRDFHLLNQVLSDPWVDVIKEKSDAQKSDGLRMLARIVANRGGSVNADLSLVQQQKIPLFSLGAALAQPSVYKGQKLIVRAKIGEIRSGNSGPPTLAMAEYDLGSSGYDVAVGAKSTTTYQGGSSSSSASAGQASGSYTSTKYGSGSASVQGSSQSVSQSQSSGSVSSQKTVTAYENVAQATGREAMGRLSKPDPFLAPNKEFIFFVTFDGVRKSDDGPEGSEGKTFAVLTIVDYWEPNPLTRF